MDCIRCGNSFDIAHSPCQRCGWNPELRHGELAGYRMSELVRGRYEVVGSLGLSRYGALLRALDTEVGVEVRLTVIHPALLPDEESIRRFLSGLRALSKVRHGVLARIFDANRENAQVFVASQLLDGVPLARLLEGRRQRGQLFALNEVRPIVEQLSDVFSEHGDLIHGALDLENVWIFPRQLKLADAGLARHLPPAAIAHLATLGGSPGRALPPEFATHGPDGRGDVHQLAALIVELLSGRDPGGRSPETWRGALHRLSPDLTRVLQAALSPNPYDRPGSLEDLLGALKAAESRGGTGAADELRSEDTQVERLALEEPLLTGDDDALIDLAAMTSAETTQVTERAALGFEPVSDPTMQVSMADVIRAHVEGTEPLAPPRRVTAERRTDPPPRPAPIAKGPRPLASAPGPRAAVVTPRPASVAATPAPRPVAPPLVTPTRPVRTTLPPPAAGKLEPRRPSAPPGLTSGGRSPSRISEAPPRPAGGLRATRREETQEVDLTDIELARLEERREATQEIDLAAIEAEELRLNAARDAVDKLERQASDAERASDAELFRRADALDGIDPRLVRAAHRLETERRGGRSKQAAELIKQRAQSLDGIDPRLLRAAARLEEARISSVEPAPEEETPAEETSDAEDWRSGIAAAPEEQVISFLAPPILDRPADVRGFPRNLQRGAEGRPPSAPPRIPGSPPPRPASRPREHVAHRALYDDSGETDDESQPTIQLRFSRLPQVRPTQFDAIQESPRRSEERLLPLTALFFFALAAVLIGFAVAGAP